MPLEFFFFFSAPTIYKVALTVIAKYVFYKLYTLYCTHAPVPVTNTR